MSTPLDPPPSQSEQPQESASPAKPKSSKRRAVITLSILVLLLAGIAVAAWYFGRDDANNAKAGDCVTKSGENDVQVVACNDPAADYKVAGRVEDVTEIDASLSSCDHFDSADSSFWQGESGGKGFVLCLDKLKK
jgi:hypothetical protein